MDKQLETLPQKIQVLSPFCHVQESGNRGHQWVTGILPIRLHTGRQRLEVVESIFRSTICEQNVYS